MRSRTSLLALLLAAAGCGGGGDGGTSVNGNDGLPGGSPLPGPALLHQPPPNAPQLENSGIWQAAPLLVSGTTAYRDGEFLYQDFLYDDRGAASAYRYPTDPVYADNAADLVELRLKLTAQALAIRLTYNSLHDAALVATTVALGDSAEARSLPHGANAATPAQLFLTLHADGVLAVDAESGDQLDASGASVSVDPQRRQLEAWIPFALFDPRGNNALRIAAATGLWDAAAGRYRTPRVSADGTSPGGAQSEQPTAFFNVAFRIGETLTAGGWRDTQQAAALAAGDLSQLFATVDFTRLADGADDPSAGTPTGGFLNRIHASRFEPAQGRGDAPSLRPADCPEQACVPSFAGQLQPYTVYLPPGPPPANGYALVLDLHDRGGNHNAFVESPRQPELAQQAGGALVVTPLARGPAYWYFGLAAADVFEVWSDLARHYPLDPARVTIAGRGMGGYGALKLAAQFPELFAGVATTLGCVSAGTGWQAGTAAPGGEGSRVDRLVPSLRHVPVMAWTGQTDEFCTPFGADRLIDALDAAGYRYEDWRLAGDHELALGDFSAQRDWLGQQPVTRQPRQFSYVIAPELSEPALDLTADRAYWLSGFELRGPGSGRVDAVSQAIATGEPRPQDPSFSSGTLAAADGSPVPYQRRARGWGEGVLLGPQDRISLTTENIRRLTLHPAAAGSNCSVQLEVSSDGPLTVVLDGCERSQSFF